MSQEFHQPTQQQQPTEQPMQRQGSGRSMQRQPPGQPMQQQPRGQSMQQPMGGQQRQQMGGQRTEPPAFEDHLTTDLRIALEDFNEVTHVAEWCAKECLMAGPQLADCARVCEDIAEIAELNEKLIARDSWFGPEVARLFVQIAQEGLPELQQHQQHHPHVIETIATIDRAIDSCMALLESGGQGTGQQMGGQQMGSQQMTGRGMQQPTGQQMQGQPTGQQF